MSEDSNETNGNLPLGGVGERLREKRLAKGMGLDQIAAETRIPQRHLITIEEGNFADLPSRTYAIGFARTYARVVGDDEAEIVTLVREELASANEMQEGPRAASFEPGDPAKVPSRGLALASGLAAVLLLVGGYTFYTTYFAPGLGPAPLQDDNAQIAEGEADIESSTAQTAQTAIATSDEVIFTSEEDGTWVKFYDASGARLFEAQMAAGDSFTIPADAEDPQIWTGRPRALAITIGGVSVPKLSEDDEVIKDVAVTAEALRTRADTAAVAGGGPVIDES